MSEKPVTSDTTRSQPALQPVPVASLCTGLVVALAAGLVIFVGSAGVRSVAQGVGARQFDAIEMFDGLASEPHFADESAMIAQSYYWTLFKSGQCNHPDWLHYAAYDHPPLPKYMFGLFLDLAGLPTPTSITPWMNWIRGDFSQPSDPRVLFWARVPAALFGVGGIVAVYLAGLQLHSRLTGMLAALLLLVNPLYLTHARRAMSDSFTECLVIASVAVALWGSKEIWQPRLRRGRWIVFVAAESVLCGLAALAKLNGGVATVIVLGVLLGCWLLARTARVQPVGSNWLPAPRMMWIPPLAAMVVGMGSFLVFVALNPFLTARPGPATLSPQSRALAEMGVFARARYLVAFRRDWTRDALNNVIFEKDWLRTTPERLRMTLWEGFGRFSPLGPRGIRTVEPRPDAERFIEYRRWCSLVWMPFVLWGVLLSLMDGWRSWRAGHTPLAWCLLLYVAATMSFVAFMIPLNWDRYYLPVQAPAALLAAFGVVAMWKHGPRGSVACRPI